MSMKHVSFIEEYRGNKNFICVLCKNKEQYWCLFGRTALPSIDEELDYDAPIYLGSEFPFLSAATCTFSTNFIVDENKFFTMIPLNDKKEYNTIYKVLESIYGND